MRPILTTELVRAASQDAGNRHMRCAGRTAWNVDDYNAAVAEFHRLMPIPKILDCRPPAKQRSHRS